MTATLRRSSETSEIPNEKERDFLDEDASYTIRPIEYVPEVWTDAPSLYDQGKEHVDDVNKRSEKVREFFSRYSDEQWDELIEQSNWGKGVDLDTSSDV